MTPIAGMQRAPTTEPNSEATHMGAPLTEKKMALNTPTPINPGTIAARRPRVSAQRPPTTIPSAPGVLVVMSSTAMRVALMPRVVRM